MKELQRNTLSVLVENSAGVLSQVSRLFSRMNFTGFYTPFTGESNLNIDSPACLLPANISHELAHQRGIASEQECNFLAILAATTCDNATYR